MDITKKQRGFSLIEILLSTAILSFISLLIFNMSSSFFKVLSSQEAKQDETKKFLKVYNSIKKTMEFSSLNLFYSYENEQLHNETRWFFYPSMLDDEGVPQSSENKIYWTKIHFWYLNNPSDSCVDRVGMCPHRSLIKVTYDYLGPQTNSIRCQAFNSFCQHADTIMVSGENPEYPKNIECEINDVKTSDMFQFNKYEVIAKNVLDISTRGEDTGIKFTMYTVKLDAAKKEIPIGYIPLYGTRFTETASWTIYPKN